MPKNLECPICEHLLTVESSQKGPESCPECEQQVEWVQVTQSSVHSLSSELTANLTGGGPPVLPRKNANHSASRSLAPPPPIKPKTKPRPVVPIADSEGAVDDIGSSDDIQLESDSSKKGPASKTQPVKAITKAAPGIPTPILITLGIATVAVLIGVVYITVFGTSRKDESADEEYRSSLTSESALKPTKPKSSKNPRDKLQTDELPTRLSMDVLEDVWPKVRNYVVALNIETANGVRPASGIVVDSRGWIATSARILEGANKVVVTWPNTDFIDGNSKSARSDEALGLIAQNKDMDIAIFAVGRNSIVELTEVEMGDSSSIVASQTLIAAAQPATDRRLWLKDCRVADRPRFDDLHPVFKSAIAKESDGKFDHDTKFLTHSAKQSPAFAGGPIFDTAGRLVAINTQHGYENKTLAVPAAVVKKLKQSANGQVTAFNRATTSNSENAVAAVDSSNQATSEPVSKPKHPEVADANNAINAARQLGMAPTNAAGYEKLKAIAATMDSVIQLRQSLEDQPDEQKSLDHEIDDLVNGIVQELSTSGELDFETAKQVNQLFLDQRVAGNEDYFAAYVVVKHPTMLSSTVEGKATISFQLVGSTQMVTSVANEEADQMIVGINGLIFGRLRREEYTLNSNGKAENSIFCEVMYFFEVKEWD